MSVSLATLISNPIGSISKEQHEGPNGVVKKNELGRGAEGVVYLMTHEETPTLTRDFARKEPNISIDFDRSQGVTKGVAGLAAKRIPHVCHTQAVHVQTPRGTKSVFTEFTALPPKGMVTAEDMEVLQGTDLSKVVPLSLDQTVDLGSQAALAVQNLHDEGIIHCDIKLQNVVLDANERGREENGKFERSFGTVRLVDFGMAQLNKGRSNIQSGSPQYSPPEVIAGQDYDKSRDVYSLGILLYAMATGTCPFTHYDYLALLDMIKEYGYSGKSLAEHADEVLAANSGPKNLVMNKKKAKYSLVSENLNVIKTQNETLYLVILLATHSLPEKRPSADAIVRALKGEISVLDLRDALEGKTKL